MRKLVRRAKRAQTFGQGGKEPTELDEEGRRIHKWKRSDFATLEFFEWLNTLPKNRKTHNGENVLEVQL